VCAGVQHRAGGAQDERGREERPAGVAQGALAAHQLGVPETALPRRHRPCAVRAHPAESNALCAPPASFSLSLSLLSGSKHTAMRKWRIVTLGISGGRSLTRPFPARFPSDTMAARTRICKVWDLSIVQGPFPVAPCPTVGFATFRIAVKLSVSCRFQPHVPAVRLHSHAAFSLVHAFQSNGNLSISKHSELL
jgi:hypothetical protein